MTKNKNELNEQYHMSKCLAAVMIIAVFVYILTSSFAFPILCKHFYYAQIDNLKLEQVSGLGREQIETAYSEVVDYCIGARDDFAVGGLKYSDAGKDHFADCRKLFILDLGLLAGSLLLLLAWFLIHKFTRLRCADLRGHGAGFWGALIELIAFAVIGGLGAIDFDRTFVIFHSLFFPGKSNWIFNPAIDEVINILPETFFMRCAIVIVGLIIAQSVIVIIASFKSVKNE